ncbi:pyruvate carboxylase [Telmatocola sphagniphila]|uniref:Pyruvate carboxylase n=1 Tax=Telmatocola sphagniphila TaxID=1123043 RepID=A0A8E6B3S8_9BACT|nr:pyruvate carboxylase [Telmatocola sphagniphila]QVL29840.1 pyruvate carboxylase [Telmatocola sphagniphila]
MTVSAKPIKKLLVANRSEIAIRVFRSAHELAIRTVAIYSHEDRFSLHRFKADEAYLVGKAGEPIRAYLDIPGIIQLAKSIGVDAIHPGYGFLSENAAFARACQEAGIIFVGPNPKILDSLGDKVAARKIAQLAKVPVLTGSSQPVSDNEEAKKIAESIGYPVMIKASMGGGGRGMRPVLTPDQLVPNLESARREAGNAFGVPDVFLEKFVRRARHIEVQLLGDNHGNLVHLYERDCSLQRRHQKIVELAPAPNLSAPLRQRILDAALAVGRAVDMNNAGTVEFLVDADTDEFYFIEVNPRIQVEHTVTEAVTGYDLVKSQILVAQGLPLSDPEIGLGDQEKITTRGFAIQCRVTTEDPANGFTPDYGRLSHYRSAGGNGIRLDAGTAFSGAVITPFYDSMLVKVTASGIRFLDAARRVERCLQEFRIRGVKTNIPFLLNLVTHPAFLEGKCTTRFLDETPELFQFSARKDRASKILNYIADIIVNGHPEAGRGNLKLPLVPKVPGVVVKSDTPIPAGSRDKFRELGPEKFSKWIRDQKPILITDTTMRDAHQSLFATRMRTFDMLAIADRYAHVHSNFFSLECWGGATFDTSMRFLKESPWERLAKLREKVPNILFQMLLRAANAVGYTNYPDNVVAAFVKESAQAGVDVFRIFDSLNWVPNMRTAIESVRNAGAICEAAICYTGDILDPKRDKYGLDYYVKLAKELEKLGNNILAIKDMAGLLKPYAARKLVQALRQEISIPIHFHTHDTAGGQIASYLMAVEEGVDIVDCAFASMAGLTSQPSLNAFIEAVRFTDRDPHYNFDELQTTANYWEEVRKYYTPFETAQKAASSEVYLHEMPGGQYANLYQQANSLGVGDRWYEVGKMYAAVNQMFGDIVKVTPSSKVVGDMTLFMLANNLTPEMVLSGTKEIAFPESVVEFFEGRLGQPPGGFPPELQKRILRGRKPMTDRPGATLASIDLEKTKTDLAAKLKIPIGDRELMSSLMYPKVYADYVEHQKKHSDTSILPTKVFFYGMDKGEEISVDIERGKTLILRYQALGDVQDDGRRQVFFELNGQPREVTVFDRSVGAGSTRAKPKADSNNPLQIGSPMPGAVVQVAVKVGETVIKGQKLLTLEAMKMETTLYAERPGTIAEVLTKPGTQVEGGDLLIRFEN